MFEGGCVVRSTLGTWGCSAAAAAGGVCLSLTPRAPLAFAPAHRVETALRGVMALLLAWLVYLGPSPRTDGRTGGRRRLRALAATVCCLTLRVSHARWYGFGQVRSDVRPTLPSWRARTAAVALRNSVIRLHGDGESTGFVLVTRSSRLLLRSETVCHVGKQ